MARILVVGPGAIGTLMAARLAADHDVLVAARTVATQDAIRKHGVHAEGFGNASAAVQVVTTLEQAGEVDLAIIATKCQAAVLAAEQWGACAREVLCVQNGIMGDALAQVLGDKLIECTVGLPATLIGPGHAVQTGPGALHIGRWPAGLEGVASVASWLQAVAPTSACANMTGVKWTKLLINSAATSLGAVSGQNLGDLLQHKDAGKVFLHVIREGYAAGQAAGVRFEPVAGLRPGLFVAMDRMGLGGLLVRILSRKYRSMRASSLQGLDRGQRTEVDHLNGVIASQGTAAPVNHAIVALLHDIESGKAKTDPGHLQALLAHAA